MSNRLDPAPNRYVQIAQFAGRQYGLVTTADLIRIGGSAATGAKLVRRGFLLRRYHGVYMVGVGQLSVRGELLAACLACGHQAVISHGSAAALWKLGELRRPIRITRPRGGASRIRGIAIHQSNYLDPQDLTRRYGIPVTTVARTVFDLARDLPLEDLEDAAALALRRGLVSIRQLRVVAGRNRCRPGSARFAELLAGFDLDLHKTRSRMERRLIRLCVADGLPRPKPGEIVNGFEVDLVWKEERLIVEFDSRAHHMDPRSFERDRERDAVHAMHGYRTLRITYRMLDGDAQAVLARIRHLLELARAEV